MEPMYKKCLILLFGFLAGLSLFILNRDQPQEVYEKAVNTLLEESPRESLEYLFKSDIKKPRELYLTAYNFHLEGNQDTAESLVKAVLLTKPKRELKGSCYYLLGLIARARGNTEEELAYFTQAVHDSVGNGRNEYLFRLERAYTQLTLNQFDHFLAAIDNLKPHLEGRDLFRLAQMLCRYNWYTENYPQVLIEAKKLNCHGSNRCESIKQLEIAFAHLLNRDIQGARTALEQLELIAYHDMKIDEMKEVFSSVVSGRPLTSPSPDDKELSSMVEWLQLFYDAK